ncbi:hypothetical protein HWV62_13561 [Athelia sp. TMB]|nr:hypothetical protein HWV62_13561 [Athelia sp. TMB]
MPPADILSSVDAFCVDAMGTCTDWRGTVPREIRARAPHLSDEGAQKTQATDRAILISTQMHKLSLKSGARASSNTRTHTPRLPPAATDLTRLSARASRTAVTAPSAQMCSTERCAPTHPVSRNADARTQILDALLASTRWSALGAQWDVQAREELVLVWHRLDAWPDASKGLYGMKAQKLLVARHADFPWDVVLSSELFGTYKPNEKVYTAAAHHLALPPAKIAMVAAHVFDLRAAARCGMRTVYVRRTAEAGDVKSKDDGGEFDVVVDDLDELAGMLEAK